MLKAMQKNSAKDFDNLDDPLHTDDDDSSEEEEDEKKNMMSSLGLIAKDKKKKGKKDKQGEGGEGDAAKGKKDEQARKDQAIASLTIKQEDTKERVVSKLSKLHSLMVKRMSTEKDGKIKKALFSKSKEISKRLLDPGSFKASQMLMVSAANLLKEKGK